MLLYEFNFLGKYLGITLRAPHRTNTALLYTENFAQSCNSSNLLLLNGVCVFIFMFLFLLKSITKNSQ